MNIFSMRQFSQEEILLLTDPTEVEVPLSSQMRGVLAFLFEQPSLRTASTFAIAGAALGLSPVFINTSFGSDFRAQTDLLDEIHQLALTGARCIVTRTSSALDPEKFKNSKIPIISGGDGPNEHPTQALIDIFTMRKFGNLDGKKIVLMGNARDHRTLHSLALGLEKFDVEVHMIHPIGMDPSEVYFTKNMKVIPCASKEERNSYLLNADFIYISPIKFNNNPFLKDEQGVASLNLSEAQKFLKADAKVLHPFPRFGELAKDLDFSNFDAYHLQTSLASQLRVRLFRFLL